jgi:hypothetical protein
MDFGYGDETFVVLLYYIYKNRQKWDCRLINTATLPCPMTVEISLYLSRLLLFFF